MSWEGLFWVIALAAIITFNAHITGAILGKLTVRVDALESAVQSLEAPGADTTQETTDD